MIKTSFSNKFLQNFQKKKILIMNLVMFLYRSRNVYHFIIRNSVRYFNYSSRNLRFGIYGYTHLRFYLFDSPCYSIYLYTFDINIMDLLREFVTYFILSYYYKRTIHCIYFVENLTTV